MDNQTLTIIIGVVALLAGIGAGKFLFAKNTRKLVEEAEQQTQKMLADAKMQAETLKKEKLLEAKEKSIRQNLALINDLKRAMIYGHLKSKM